MDVQGWKQGASDYDPAAIAQEAQADAWDEGIAAARAYGVHGLDLVENPYRKVYGDTP